MPELSQRELLLNIKENQRFRNNYIIISKETSLQNNGFATPLGEGGSGIVYVAEQIFLNSIKVKRAVKFFVFRDDIANKNKNRISIQNFNDEILNISSFNHENIIKIIDGGVDKRKDEDIPFIVTDYVEGHSLDQLITDPNLVKGYIESGEDIIDIFGQICTGLSYLHKKSFYHCDIAPKNIFIKGEKGNFQIVIGDLGVGKTLISDQLNKGKLIVHGSKIYMPANVALLKNKEIEYIDFLSLQPLWDLHSLKVTFIELIEAFEMVIKPEGIWFKSLKKIVNKDFKKIQDIARNIERIKPVYRQTAGISELSEADSSLHGHYELHPIKSVWITDRIKKVIKHPAFLRLKKVPQLLSSNSFNPGSNHTRYEHALGTYENMRKVLMSLLRNEDFLEILDEHHIKLALVASLICSLPKFPLSFAIHEIRDRDNNYFNKFNTKNILLHLLNHKMGAEHTLREIIEKQFSNIDLDEVIKIITNNPGTKWGLDISIISKLINSTIDVRVLDFLPRDSYHLGISSGAHIDFESLINSICLHEGSFAIKSKGVTNVEQVVTLRYWLYKRVYWNSPNRAYVSVLKYIFISLYLKKKSFEDKLFKKCFISDTNELLQFLQQQIGNDPVLGNLLNTIYSPRPAGFWEIFIINQTESVAGLNDICDKYSKLPFAEIENLRIELEVELSKVLNLKPNEISILIDIPNEDNKKLGEDLTVVKHDNQVVPLKRVSGLIEGIGNTFDDNLKFIRVYLNPMYRDQLRDEKKGDQIKQVILNFLKEHA